MRLCRMIAAALVGLAVMGTASSGVRANTIFVSFAVTSAGDTAGATEFTYNVSIGEGNGTPPLDSRVETGDFFTIYDFAGFILGSDESSDSDWVFVGPSLLGLTPLVPGSPVVIPADDPTLFNLTWQYVGLTPIDAPDSIGTFSAESIFHTTTTDNYASQDHREVTDGGLYAAAGYIDTTTVAAVPLPAAAWAGMALFGMIGGVKLRQSRRASLL